MSTGLLSTSLVVSGTYLIVNSYQTFGGFLVGCGIIGGSINFLYQLSLALNKEKRGLEIFEISKGLITKLLQVVNEFSVISQQIKETIH